MLSSAIRRLVAPVLRSCPPECGIVALTSVEVSPDFSHATVLIGALEHAEKALSYLESQVPRLQRELGTLRRKKIPMLRFRIDRRQEEATRIDALLDRLS